MQPKKCKSWCSNTGKAEYDGLCYPHWLASRQKIKTVEDIK